MARLIKRIRSAAWLEAARKKSPFFEPVADEFDGYLVIIAQVDDDHVHYPDREDLAASNVAGADLDARVHEGFTEEHFQAIGTVFDDFLVVLAGDEIATAALDPGLIKGALEACELDWQETVHVYLPSCDGLVLSKRAIPEGLCEQLDLTASALAEEIDIEDDPTRHLGVQAAFELKDTKAIGEFIVPILRRVERED